MAATWAQYADWSFRIVREEGSAPFLWHIIVDEPNHEIEVTQCGDGTRSWVDLQDVSALRHLRHLCPECAKGLGQFAAAASESLW